MADKKGSQLPVIEPTGQDKLLAVDYEDSQSATIRVQDLAKGMPLATEAAAGPVVLADNGEATAGKVVQANDSRLSDARTPTAHADSHASAGGDPITPAQIGALPASDYTAADVLAKLLTVDGAGSGLLADDIDLGGGLTAVGQGQVGLSVSNLPQESDFNSLLIQGRYGMPTTALNSPSPGMQTVVDVIRFDSQVLYHVAIGRAQSGRLFIRRTIDNGSSWEPWTEYYSQRSILGTVSMSGGVPTGAIIERGSNANGEYVRFADGTQICWKYGITLTQISSTHISTTWTFPAAFTPGDRTGFIIPPGLVSDFVNIDTESVGAAAALQGSSSSVGVGFRRTYGGVAFPSGGELRNCTVFYAGRWF